MLNTRSWIAAFVGASLVSIIPVALAESEEGTLSFSKQDAYHSVNNSIEMLTTWARGEYAEHEGEGLFTRHPEDGSVISATIALVNELKQLAAKARAEGDEMKARAYLFSAEATARYAAQMPHLLEDRLAKNAKQRD
ncbi:MAG: hypothetical protein COB33_011025 [Thiotrichaceae bacterium]|nr:hypothetical protein [Thiotrichaceae bacterium]